MNAMTAFIVAVMAGVVTHLICKWLGSRNDKNDN